MIDVLKDPEQEGLLGYVETWAEKKVGFVVVRASPGLHFHDYFAHFVKARDFKETFLPEMERRLSVREWKMKKLRLYKTKVAAEELSDKITSLYGRAKLVEQVKWASRTGSHQRKETP